MLSRLRPDMPKERVTTKFSRMTLPDMDVLIVFHIQCFGISELADQPGTRFLRATEFALLIGLMVTFGIQMTWRNTNMTITIYCEVERLLSKAGYGR